MRYLDRSEYPRLILAVSAVLPGNICWPIVLRPGDKIRVSMRGWDIVCIEAAQDLQFSGWDALASNLEEWEDGSRTVFYEPVLREEVSRYLA